MTFHACAHGGTRDKSTSIWQSQPYFDSLALQCDRKHKHASWRPAVKNGVMTYPTAEEAAYPTLLCERIIACVLTKVVQFSLQDFQQQTVLQQSTQQRRIAMGALPRGNKSNLWLPSSKGMKQSFAILNRSKRSCENCQKEPG